MRHMKPAQWELAWRLRRDPRWAWRSGMGMLYPDGSFTTYQGFLLPAGEPLPYLVNDRTAGCLMGLLAESGPGWQGLLGEELAAAEDWREGVARALLRRWEALASATAA